MVMTMVHRLTHGGENGTQITHGGDNGTQITHGGNNGTHTYMYSW